MDDRSDQGCMDGIGRPVHSTDCQSVRHDHHHHTIGLWRWRFPLPCFSSARPSPSLSLSVHPSGCQLIPRVHGGLLTTDIIQLHCVCVAGRIRNPTHPSRSCVFACVSREMKSTSTTRVSALHRWLSRSSRIRRASICISIHPLASRVRGATLMPCPSQKAS